MRILIVEDEAIPALAIARELRKMGHTIVATANSYESAIHSLKTNAVDVALLDIHLPGENDGITLAHEMQEIANTPVLFITADHDEATMQRAILANPLAYLCKPYRTKELRYSIMQAEYKICSLKHNLDDRVSIADGYDYDKKNKILYYQNNPIKLSQKERLLLELLIEHQSKIVSFSTIENHIWHYPIPNSTRRSLIHRLNLKLGGIGIIECTPREGCKIPLI